MGVKANLCNTFFIVKSCSMIIKHPITVQNHSFYVNIRQQLPYDFVILIAFMILWSTLKCMQKRTSSAVETNVMLIARSQYVLKNAKILKQKHKTNMNCICKTIRMTVS